MVGDPVRVSFFENMNHERLCTDVIRKSSKLPSMPELICSTLQRHTLEGNLRRRCEHFANRGDKDLTSHSLGAALSKSLAFVEPISSSRRNFSGGSVKDPTLVDCLVNSAFLACPVSLLAYSFCEASSKVPRRAWRASV